MYEYTLNFYSSYSSTCFIHVLYSLCTSFHCAANKNWSQPMHLSGPNSEPQPRAGHGMCGLHNGRKLTVFGGRTADGRTNELFFYDTGALFILRTILCNSESRSIY